MHYFLISLLLLFAPSARAEEVFYIELGNAKTAEEADLLWQQLLDDHTALLGDVRYTPRTVVHGGRYTLIHVQAGPIEERAAAQRLCHKLFREDVLCFVIEGRMPEYARADKPEPLPWLIEEQPEVLPWLAEEQEQQEAKMQVAEAIRVPLSDRINAPIIETRLAETPSQTRSEAYQARRRKPVVVANVTLYWLQLGTASTQLDAATLWEQSSRAHGDLLEGLRGSIAPQDYGAAYAISAGPISTREEAGDLCYRLKERGAACHVLGGGL